MATKVVTGEVRLSYCHLLEPQSSFEGQAPRYSVVLLIPKTDTKTVEALKAAQREALENGKSSKFNGTIPKNWKNTMRDGDEDADLERNPEYSGHYFMNVSSKTRPGIVDANLNQVMDAGEVYSGVYARVSINAFPFNTQGNKGVSFGLNNVQVLGKGEPLSGVTRAEDDFSAVASDLL